jgi:hypothetical protein
MWKFEIKRKHSNAFSRSRLSTKSSRIKEGTKKRKLLCESKEKKRSLRSRKKTSSKSKKESPKLKENTEFEIVSYINQKREEEIKRFKKYSEEFSTRVQEIRKEMSTLNNRWQWRKKMDLQDELFEKENYIRKFESGEYLKEFEKKVEPYVYKINFLKKLDSGENINVASQSHPSNSKYRRVGTGKKYQKESLELELKLKLKEKNVEMPIYLVQGDICTECNEPMMILGSESLLACPKCKRTRVFIQATSSRIAYGEEVEFTSFSYKRQNHFQEWLTCFQAKESTEIPLKTLESVMEMLWVMGVRSCNEVTSIIVREALKKLKLRKIYENTAQITSRISGRPPPRMTPQQEEQARNMFSAIQQPFNKHCPPDRRNFLSYAYACYKIVELMGWDEYKSSFSLLKGQDKLKKQDQIFKFICQDLDWEFIESSRE